eukprot:5642427-Pyramimonas_sp.AAC.1
MDEETKGNIEDTWDHLRDVDGTENNAEPLKGQENDSDNDSVTGGASGSGGALGSHGAPRSSGAAAPPPPPPPPPSDPVDEGRD